MDFNSILITNLNEVLYEVSARFHWDLLFYVQHFYLVHLLFKCLLYIVLYFLIGGASYSIQPKLRNQGYSKGKSCTNKVSFCKMIKLRKNMCPTRRF